MSLNIFKIYNPITQDNLLEENCIEIKNTKELYDIIGKYWNVGPNQIKFDYNDYLKQYIVKLTNKTGETFANIGELNFNPYIYY